MKKKSTNLKKKLASSWFTDLRNQICKKFEDIENKYSNKKIKFLRKKWKKSKTKSEGGGEISILRNGKIFEKVGVNISVVNGFFNSEFKKKFQVRRKALNFGLLEYH